MPLSSRQQAALGPLFNPQSIAVVGASSNPAKIGGLPVDYLLNQRYPGAITRSTRSRNAFRVCRLIRPSATSVHRSTWPSARYPPRVSCPLSKTRRRPVCVRW